MANLIAQHTIEFASRKIVPIARTTGRFEMTIKSLLTVLTILTPLTPCAYAQEKTVLDAHSETIAQQSPLTVAQNSRTHTYRTLFSQAYIGDFGDLVQPNSVIRRDELGSDPSKESEAPSENKQKAQQETQLPPKTYIKTDANNEYTLALLAAKEKRPQHADAHFREAVAAQRCGKYDRKLEAQIMSAYAKFLKSQDRLIEAKEILTQLRDRKSVV